MAKFRRASGVPGGRRARDERDPIQRNQVALRDRLCLHVEPKSIAIDPRRPPHGSCPGLFPACRFRSVSRYSFLPAEESEDLALASDGGRPHRLSLFQRIRICRPRRDLPLLRDLSGVLPASRLLVDDPPADGLFHHP